MANILSLELDKGKEITLEEQAGNILNNISDAFSNAVKKGAEKINFPDNLGEKVKEGLEKIEKYKETVFWSFSRKDYQKTNWWSKTASANISSNLTIRTANTVRKIVSM